MTNNRKCRQCDAHEPEVEIYDIMLPPIPRGFYCKSCMQTLIDNSIKKNAAKSREVNK
jgi:hypothetical protein